MVALVCVLGIAGCKKDVLHGLDEVEANRVIVVLAKHGITADKEPDTAGDEGPRYKIVTDEKDAVRASEILLELGLPRKKKKGLADVYATPSMIPTDMEEKARNLLALQGELASTLEAIDGVVDARVHLVLPELGLLGDRGPERGGQASVLVKHEVVKRPGGELSEREQLEKYRGMLISLQGDLREVRKALREELPAINKQQIGAINAIDVYLDKHRDDREARSALAALASLKQLTTRMRDRLAYLAALPKIKD
ncbi:MAG: hypothetical protein D6776_09415, partial [Planctomycetota bacterium]